MRLRGKRSPDQVSHDYDYDYGSYQFLRIFKHFRTNMIQFENNWSFEMSQYLITSGKASVPNSIIQWLKCCLANAKMRKEDQSPVSQMGDKL